MNILVFINNSKISKDFRTWQVAGEHLLALKYIFRKTLYEPEKLLVHHG